MSAAAGSGAVGDRDDERVVAQADTAAGATDADDDDEKDVGYKVAAKVDLHALLASKTGDESLQRYKETLIGAAVAAAPDPLGRQLVIKEMRIEVAGRPDIVIPLGTPEEVAAAGQMKLVVKEGCEYVTKVVFQVFKDVVLGLKFTNIVTKMGIKVDKQTQMIGSYAPRAEPYEFRFPADTWPSGMLARGSYGAKTTFSDDDGTTHLNFAWRFDIKKDWNS